MNDPVEWAKSVATMVKDYCGRALEPVLARLAVLEQRQPEKGEPGKSVTVEDVTPIIEQAVSNAVSKIPPAKDGKSVTVEDVAPLIESAVSAIPVPKSLTLDDIRPIVAEAVAEIPRPQDGKSVTVDELRPVIKELVDQIPRPKDGIDGTSVTADEIGAIQAKATEVARQAIAELPRPKDGIDGKSVTPEEILPTVKEWFDSLPKPRDGIDGKSVTIEEVAPLFGQAFDKWALDFERRAQDIHTRLLSSFDKPKDGRDGKDGADGLGFDDIDITHDGERGFKIAVVRGERRKEFTFHLPVVIERGVYKSGQDYTRGDAVTFDGSYWIAQKDTPTGKPGQSPDWRLAVKKGRDGKGS